MQCHIYHLKRNKGWWISNDIHLVLSLGHLAYNWAQHFYTNRAHTEKCLTCRSSRPAAAACPVPQPPRSLSSTALCCWTSGSSVPPADTISVADITPHHCSKGSRQRAKEKKKPNKTTNNKTKNITQNKTCSHFRQKESGSNRHQQPHSFQLKRRSLHCNRHMQHFNALSRL